MAVSSARWLVCTSPASASDTFLESPSPKKTPTPATALTLPLLRLLPSVYTRSTSAPSCASKPRFSKSTELPLFVSFALFAGGCDELGSFSSSLPTLRFFTGRATGTTAPPCLTNDSASSLVANFLYLGFFHPVICSLASSHVVYTPGVFPQATP